MKPEKESARLLEGPSQPFGTQLGKHPTDAPLANAAWLTGQLAIMVALLASGPLGTKPPPRRSTRLLSVALGFLGAGLGLAGIRALGKNLTPFPQPKTDCSLVTTGVYARLRHPLYASVIAFGFGWALRWRNPATLALALFQAVYLHAKARLEERLLGQRFASYAAYARRVPAYFPRLLPQRWLSPPAAQS